MSLMRELCSSAVLGAGCTLAAPEGPSIDSPADNGTTTTEGECPSAPIGIAGATCVVSTESDWYEEGSGAYDFLVSGVVTAAGTDITAPEGSNGPWADNCDPTGFGVQIVDDHGETWTIGWTFESEDQPPTDAFATGAELQVRGLYVPGYYTPGTKALALYKDEQVVFAYEAERALTLDERGGLEVEIEPGCIVQGDDGAVDYHYVRFVGPQSESMLQQGDSGVIAGTAHDLRATVLSSGWWLDCTDACGFHEWVIWPSVP